MMHWFTPNITLSTVPGGRRNVNPAIVTYPGSFAVAGTYAVTTPQIDAEALALAVTVSATILPNRSTEAFRQMLAHNPIWTFPVIRVPAAIGIVWPPMVIEPSVVAVAAT